MAGTVISASLVTGHNRDALGKWLDYWKEVPCLT
jgi:hypothetical protein